MIAGMSPERNPVSHCTGVRLRLSMLYVHVCVCVLVCTRKEVDSDRAGMHEQVAI